MAQARRRDRPEGAAGEERGGDAPRGRGVVARGPQRETATRAGVRLPRRAARLADLAAAERRRTPPPAAQKLLANRRRTTAGSARRGKRDRDGAGGDRALRAACQRSERDRRRRRAPSELPELRRRPTAEAVKGLWRRGEFLIAGRRRRALRRAGQARRGDHARWRSRRCGPSPSRGRRDPDGDRRRASRGSSRCRGRRLDPRRRARELRRRSASILALARAKKPECKPA